MVIIHKSEQYKYKPKQQGKELIKYGNGIASTNNGKALYLPKRQFFSEGQGMLDDTIKFISENKDLIKDVASTVGTVVDSAGKAATTTLDIIKKARELKNQGISNEALQEVLNRKPKSSTQSISQSDQKTGAGFFYIKDE